MSNEEKLQAIRQQAQREKAERIQRDQASNARSGYRQKRRTGIRVKELLVIPIALAVGLWLWNHYSQPEPEEEDFFEKYAGVVETRDKAVAYAALGYLQRQGWNIDLISEMSASSLGTTGNFKVQFSHDGSSYQIVAQQACQPNGVDLNAQRDPDCYIWASQ